MQDIHFIGRNIEVTPALKEFTEKKFQKLDRRLHDITNINVTFHVEKEDQIAEATVHVRGHDFHASSKSSDLYEAIDTLTDKLTTQLTKHKEQQTDHH